MSGFQAWLRQLQFDGVWQTVLLVLASLLCITFHELCHGLVAFWLGDRTAKDQGRLTLNPLRHVDLSGLIMMALFRFGWAKPVPVNPRNFRNYRRDDLLVSIAGVTMNLILFLLGSIVYYVIVGFSLKNEGLYLSLFYTQTGIAYYLMQMLYHLIITNLSLAIFNLIPVPPLDGYHVLNDLVLKRNLFATQQAARFGQIALLVLMWSGYLGRFLSWAAGGALNGIDQVFFSIYRMIGLI